MIAGASFGWILMRRMAALAAACLLQACGGGGTEVSPPPPPPPPPAPPVATVTVAPDSVVVLTGATVQLNATLKDAQGTVLTGPVVSWSSTTPGVASVSGSGMVTAAQVGHSLVVASSGGKSDTATVYVQPASLGGPVAQTIGPAGGTINVPVGGGITVSLGIPSGALTGPVSIVLTPKLPALGGSLFAVTLSPADLSFHKPVTLTLTLTTALGTSDAQHLSLALGTTGSPATLFLPTSSSDGRTFTATTALVSTVPHAGPAALRGDQRASAETGDPELDAILTTTAQKIAALRAAAQNLEATLQFEAAIRYRLAAAVLAQGIQDDPAAANAEFNAARIDACQRLVSHDGIAATRLGADFRNLWAALRPVLSWSGAAEGIGVNPASCPERGKLNQVLTELIQGNAEHAGFLELYTTAMQRSTFAQNFEALADEVYKALHARQYGTLLGLETAFADIKTKIQLPLAQRLRAGAYAWCVTDQNHTYLGTIFAWARDGGVLPLGLAPVERLREAVIPQDDFGYDVAALANDLQYCATSVSVYTTATDGSPPVDTGPFGGLGTPGSITTGATLAAPPHGTLELFGTLNAFFCPNEAYGDDHITVEFNGQAIRDIFQLGPTGTFLRSPSTFSVADLLTQGQVPAHGGGSFPFKLIRKSDRCAGKYLPPGDPPNQDLIVLQLTYPKVTVAPTAATVNTGGTVTLAATVQFSTQGVTWEAAGGTLAGSGNTVTYTAGNTAGTFTVKAKSVADPERWATATITVNEQCSLLGSLLRGSERAAVCEAPLQIVSTGMPAGNVGTAYDQGIAVSGGNQQYSWSVISGSLPPGLGLNSSTGRITGTPTVTGTSTFTVKVVSGTQQVTKQLSILINPAAVQFMVYEGDRHITVVNTDNHALLWVYALPSGSYCFVLNFGTTRPITGGDTCPAGDYGSWTGTINGGTLTATAGPFTKPPTITGTISASAVSWSGTDSAFGLQVLYTFTGSRITPP